MQNETQINIKIETKQKENKRKYFGTKCVLMGSRHNPKIFPRAKNRFK
jgi:hypothetical protein